MYHLKIKCPKSNKHKRFSVTAHVAQEWKVDEKGEFMESLADCLEVTHRPEKGDLFSCLSCGSEAEVENDDLYAPGR